MATLAEGARAVVQGSGSNRYTLEHKGEVYSCTCPAWRNQNVRIEQRTCKHLRAYLGNDEETARVGAAAIAPRDYRIRARRVTHFMEHRERRAERHAALDRAVERTPVLDDRMQTVYGLRLPRHLAYAMGFWMGLDDDEKKEAWAYLGNGPVGVGAWYLDDALDRRVKPGLDERLDYRFRCDPPEMVSIFSGNSDGGHWGLWYDDPNELPSTIVKNYARDSAETWRCKRTLLESLHESVAGRDDESSFLPEEWPHRTAILDWMNDVLEREVEAYVDQAPRIVGSHPLTLGGLGSVGGEWVARSDDDRFATPDARYEAYKTKDAVVSEWIALAKKELDAGTPARALCLGRELHWLDADEWRADCTELLVRAYEKLGRSALAEIVKVHHAHRDLGSVDVYERPEESPLATAAIEGDVERLRAELAKYMPSPRELASALASTNLAVLDLLLALPGADAASESAIVAHLALAKRTEKGDAYPEINALAAASRAAAIRIFEKLGARGKAFAAALAAEPDVRECALAHADLAWRSARGRSVLHLAAALPSLEGVRALLDRGIDPRVRDQDGETAFEATRSGREKNPRMAADICELLDARGGGPPKEVVVTTAEWTAGTRVAHKQFGEGVVEGASGVGDQIKLTIKFANATKTLVAKFVTRI